jgi:hypothetical protein
VLLDLTKPEADGAKSKASATWFDTDRESLFLPPGLLMDESLILEGVLMPEVRTKR